MFALFGMEGVQDRLIDSYSHGMRKDQLLRVPIALSDHRGRRSTAST